MIDANKSKLDALIAADCLFEIVDLGAETDYDNKMYLTPYRVGDILFKEILFRYGTGITVFECLVY